MVLETETFLVDISVTAELDFNQRRDLFAARQRTMTQIIYLCVTLMSLPAGSILFQPMLTPGVDKPAQAAAQLAKVTGWAEAGWVFLALSVLSAVIFLMAGPQWVKGPARHHPVVTLMDWSYWLALAFFVIALGLVGRITYLLLH